MRLGEINIELTEGIVEPWEIGYKISNRYEIQDIKKGGMGIVYLAYDHEKNYNFAIKTFQDKYLWNNDHINLFLKEAIIWSRFGYHPNLTNAFLVEKIEGKPLIFLEYVNLGDLNQFIGKLDILTCLDFAIQICNGMEYLYKKYHIIHKDIKPGNLLIKEDLRFKYGYCIKITDFGLAGILRNETKEKRTHVSSGKGTPAYMPPEQFSSYYKNLFAFKGKVTTKSDIYSLGMTLYHLLTGKLPFDDINEIFTRDPDNPKDINNGINEDLDSIIMKCIKKNPNDRYDDFFELKMDLIEHYNLLTGQKYDILAKEEELTYIGLNIKGLSFLNLQKYDEAIEYFNKSLKLNPDYPEAWNNKGSAFKDLGNIPNALCCYDKALNLDPSNLGALNNKGIIAKDLNKYDEALTLFNNALQINSNLAELWINKGNILDLLRKLKNALDCYKEASKIDSRNPDIWYNQGMVLFSLRSFSDSEKAFDQSLSINPRYFQSYNYKGIIKAEMGEYPEAIVNFNKAIKIKKDLVEAWSNKGNTFRLMGECSKALECLNIALEINSEYIPAYNNKGITFIQLNMFPEALKCYNKALEIDKNSSEAGMGKGNTLRLMGKYQESLDCYNTILKLYPKNYNALYGKYLIYCSLKKNRKAFKYLFILLISKYFRFY